MSKDHFFKVRLDEAALNHYRESARARGLSLSEAARAGLGLFLDGELPDSVPTTVTTTSSVVGTDSRAAEIEELRKLAAGELVIPRMRDPRVAPSAGEPPNTSTVPGPNEGSKAVEMGSPRKCRYHPLLAQPAGSAFSSCCQTRL